MIAKVTRGTRVAGLVAYLVGPGRHDEHTDQHVIASSDEMDVADPTLSAPGARRGFTADLNHYKDLYDVTVPRGEVYHFSLSNPAGERVLSDAEWAATARGALGAVGLADDGPKAPVRWAAVRHGLSTAGNDHVHVVVVLARADGTKAAPHDDYNKLNRYCAAAERELGLASDRTPGRGTRAVPPASRADLQASGRAGEVLPLRERVQRDVRAAATAASTETDFVDGLRRAGLYVHPRYGEGGRAEVTGYKVAALRERDPEGHLVYFAGGRLARDLSLPALRTGWGDSPGERTRALVAWGEQPGRRDGPGGPGGATGERGPSSGWQGEPDPAAAMAAARQLHAAAQRLGASPAASWEQWAGVARETSGLLAAASSGWEGSRGGDLDRASRRLAQASAGAARRGGHRASSAGMGLEDLATVLMAGSGKGGSAALLMQLTRTAEAIAEASHAVQVARSAHQETALLRQRHAGAGTAAAVAGRAVGRMATATATAGPVTPAGAGAGGPATMSESPETEAMESLRPLAVAAAASASQAARMVQRMGERSADRARAQAEQERQVEELRREARAAYRELARREDWVGHASADDLRQAVEALGSGADPRDRDALHRVEESGRDRFGDAWPKEATSHEKADLSDGARGRDAGAREAFARGEHDEQPTGAGTSQAGAGAEGSKPGGTSTAPTIGGSDGEPVLAAAGGRLSIRKARGRGRVTGRTGPARRPDDPSRETQVER
ncbi:relaxase/mobilization nuclease domain-containing protein [Aquipuribacter hungaricus]|uniref:Relaxase/mobilization nuclease domain-containing protein n=1 Tax=Aquipuribacter hungaricus TaxID=545624 RepID=A0ABV7WBZ9_9MICO